MDDSDGWSLADVLHRRHDVLAATGSEAVGKRTLTDRVDVSRSTVDRAVRELERAGLVERVNGGVRRTLAGTLAISEHRRTVERLAGIGEATPVLTALSTDTDVDVTALVGGTVVCPTTDSPYAPVRYQDEVVADAGAVRIYATAVVDPQVELFYDRVVDDGMDLTMVLTDAVVDRLMADYREQFVDSVAREHVTAYRTDRHVPYGLCVTDETSSCEMFLSVYDDDGIVGTVGNDTPESVAWASRRVDELIAAAEPISPP